MSSMTTSPTPHLPAWVSINREAGKTVVSNGTSMKVEPLQSTWPPPDWTAEDVAQWEAERAAIASELDVDDRGALGEPDPWDEVPQAAPDGEDLIDRDWVPWDESPDPLEPHGTCSGLNVWWTATGRARCADCDPPTASRRLLRLNRQELARESERLWRIHRLLDVAWGGSQRPAKAAPGAG